jgi:hypothetical protein
MAGMLFPDEMLAAISAEREREVERLLKAREARPADERSAKHDGRWAWRVEPGMAEAFGSLRSWLLSGADEGQVERAA